MTKQKENKPISHEHHVLSNKQRSKQAVLEHLNLKIDWFGHEVDIDEIIVRGTVKDGLGTRFNQDILNASFVGFQD